MLKMPLEAKRFQGTEGLKRNATRLLLAVAKSQKAAAGCIHSKSASISGRMAGSCVWCLKGRNVKIIRTGIR